jgi:peptidoglycan/xylan/chitin deacetylase (PgdA/CDA1 family)
MENKLRMKINKTKIFVRIISLLLIVVSLVLVGCEEETVYHPAGNGGDLAVMGTVGTDTDKEDGSKRVAITFDDGPHNVITKKIVDELEKYGFSATFFVLGNRIDGTEYNGTSGLKYAYENGHEIAIHGYTHRIYYDKCSDSEYKDELSMTAKAIKDVIGAPIHLMRPVGGRITEERINSCQYSVVKWDVDSEDWKYKYTNRDDTPDAEERVETIVNNVMSSVKDGSIILLHDIYASTYDATVIILERLYEEGYEVVSVSELLGADRAAGTLYMSGR